MAPLHDDGDGRPTTTNAADEETETCEAMRDLVRGYKTFRAAHFSDDAGRGNGTTGTSSVKDTLRELSERGQAPSALVIACCDSRADPAIVFATSPGEVFVVRNVANLVPPYTGVDGAHHGTCAAIEYSVQHLRVPLILVMGHTQCGGAAAALKKYGNGPNADAGFLGANEETGEGFIGSWINLAERVVCEVCEEHDPDIRARMLEFELVKNSVKNLHTFPFIAERVKAGELEIRGAVFNVFNGTLKILQPNGRFVTPKDEDASDKSASADVAPPEAKRAREE
jgi:carbonic anhydrase